MQTFLPYESFDQSARCLDSKRLGKQRVEAWQIYQALTVPGYGWKNHPAVQMWRDRKYAILNYGIQICQEWIRRGFADKMIGRFVSKLLYEYQISTALPPWLGDLRFHAAHRAILLAKNYEWYKQFGWTEKPAVKINGKWPYVWPV
ncbi:MAG: MSMEG_6728 family protein [Eubacteriales bacterium]|jgi:hypothetical protein